MMNDIASDFVNECYESIKNRVYEIADYIQNNIQYETSNDLIFAGKEKDKKTLDGVQIQVIEESNGSFRIIANLDGLTDDQKESFEIYFNNSKEKAT